MKTHPTLISCIYRKDGQEKAFQLSMDRFEELIERCNKEFGNGIDIGGPSLIQPQAGKSKVGRKK
jgi:hypothetical protein